MLFIIICLLLVYFFKVKKTRKSFIKLKSTTNTTNEPTINETVMSFLDSGTINFNGDLKVKGNLVTEKICSSKGSCIQLNNYLINLVTGGNKFSLIKNDIEHIVNDNKVWSSSMERNWYKDTFKPNEGTKCIKGGNDKNIPPQGSSQGFYQPPGRDNPGYYDISCKNNLLESIRFRDL